MKKLWSIGLCILLSGQAFCAEYRITKEEELKSLATKLLPGDMVTIADGTYLPWALSLTLQGTAAKPVIIRAAHPGKVIFTGDVTQAVFRISGSYAELQGLSFSGCTIFKATGQTGLLIELENTDHCRITDCLFTGNTVKAQFMPIVVISGNGKSNRVDHCRFITNTDNQELQVKVTKEAFPVKTLIDHNVFSDKKRVSWANDNGGECVQVGQDPVLLGTLVAETTVRENTFTRCGGEPEVISNKCSGNTYSKNVFEDCDGELVMRGGHDCRIDSNTFNGGSGGIRINGTGHILTNNTISHVKTGIRLMYGMAKGKTEIGFYIAAGDCIIRNNTISDATVGILVGDSKNADWTGKFDIARYPSRVLQDVPPYENKISGNSFIRTGREMVEQ